MFYLIGRNLLALAEAYFEELPQWQALSFVTVCTATVTYNNYCISPTQYICCFLTDVQWTMVCSLRVYLCVYVREIKLVKCARVIKQKDKDVNQYKNCSTVHAHHLTAISSILIGKSAE
jgi:hypothetical protein